MPSTKRSLPIALARARETVMMPFREMLAAEGISEQQWRILRVLSENDTLTASAVCEHAALMPSSFTRTATTMSERGLLSKAQGINDRRSRSFEITTKGQALLDRNRVHSAEIVDVYKARLGSVKYEQLLNLLAELSEPL